MPIKLQHVQLLGWPTGALALVWMLLVRMSIYGQCRLHSNPADVYKSPRKVRNVTRQIFRRLFPAGHETTKLHVKDTIWNRKPGFKASLSVRETYITVTNKSKLVQPPLYSLSMKHVFKHLLILSTSVELILSISYSLPHTHSYTHSCCNSPTPVLCLLQETLWGNGSWQATSAVC